MARGLVLFAHGARDPAWSRPLLELAALVRERDPALVVRVAYLEIDEPSLAQAIDEIAPACESIAVLPVFWSAGGHVKRDLAALVDAAGARHPSISFGVLPTLSELPGLLDFIADRAVRDAR